MPQRNIRLKDHVLTSQILIFSNSKTSYWGSYFKYKKRLRKRCLCAVWNAAKAWAWVLEGGGCPCQCAWMPLQGSATSNEKPKSAATCCPRVSCAIRVYGAFFPVKLVSHSQFVASHFPLTPPPPQLTRGERVLVLRTGFKALLFNGSESSHVGKSEVIPTTKTTDITRLWSPVASKVPATRRPGAASGFPRNRTAEERMAWGIRGVGGRRVWVKKEEGQNHRKMRQRDCKGSVLLGT